MRLAFSYLRFSSAVQGEGDSIRRQTAAAENWCKRNGFTLDSSVVLQDRGVSAFRGRNRQTGVLARFLAEVEAGRIPRGSVLIVEALDRLSRENPWDAIPLLCQIVNLGVSVVTLSPAEVTYTRGRDLTGLILAVVEFGRGHSESAVKSDRLTALWDEKKRRAQTEGAIITRRLPAWIEERGGRLCLIEDRAKTVRRIFDLAIAGCGLFLIAQKLTEEGVKPWGRARHWSKCYIRRILVGRTVRTEGGRRVVTGRAAIGEHQPMKGGKPDGDPLPNYYPAVVDLDTYERAQAAMQRRKERPGRIGRRVACLFTGLLMDARTRERMFICHQRRGVGKKKRSVRVIVPATSTEGLGAAISFPYETFETGVLSCLREVSASDVFASAPESQVMTLTGKLAAVQQRRQQIEAELAGEGEDVPALVRVLKSLDAQEQELLAQLAVARQEETAAKSAALAEAQTLVEAAKSEQNRIRLRDLLRTAIETVWVLVVPRRSFRFAAVQVDFRGGARRHYLLGYQGGGYCRPGRQFPPRSYALDAGAESIDLGNPDHAARVERALLSLDLAKV